MDFRLFLLRHLELLNALSHWTIRVLFPRSLAWAMDTFENAAYDHLAKPLTPVGRRRTEVVLSAFSLRRPSRQRAVMMAAYAPHVRSFGRHDSRPSAGVGSRKGTA